MYVLRNNTSQTSWIKRPRVGAVHELLRVIIGSDRSIAVVTVLVGLGFVVAVRRGRQLERLVSAAGPTAFVGPSAMV